MSGKIYVITGSTSGIGLALVKSLAKENKIFAGYRNSEKLSILKDLSDNISPFYIDMHDRNSIKSASDYINNNCEKIDTLINVAGCVVAGVVEDLDVERIKEQFDVNTFSHLDFSQKLLDKLEGGKIINISSMSSFGIFPFVAPYCASKRALDILFNSMALEFNRNIKVVSIKPGVIATPLWEKSIEGNKNEIENCADKYSRQMKYLVKGAKRNGEKGLAVSRVVETILKADSLENPKPSYTVGRDAKFAELFSRMPFEWQNKLIKLGLRYKVKLSETKD